MSARPVANPCFRQQTTIAAPVSVEGFGFWSGLGVRVEIRPAPAHSGIVFVRSDVDPQVRIPATIDYRVESPRRTTLSVRGTTVEMVEHILAALAGLRVDNCEIWVDAAEMPGMDGSSRAWVDALDSVPHVELDAVRPYLYVTEPTRVGTNDTWVEARPTTQAGFFAKARIDYGKHTAIGRQTCELDLTPASFRRELASARTFILQEEARWLLSQGLCRRATSADALVFDDDGPINNTLLFENECVRHKLLDMIGDLALCGCDLVGYFVAHCSGHRLNAELVRALLTEFQVVADQRRSA